MTNKIKVIIRKVQDYDPKIIKDVIRDGLEELGVSDKIGGRITIKPNVVMAHHKIAPTAYTRPEFIAGLLDALKEVDSEGTEITIAEKCGTGLPTSRMLRRAGYYQLKKSHNIKIRPIEEARKKRIKLYKGRIHEELTTSVEIVDNDLLIYTPKLKSNVLAQGLTASIKLNIGILLDKERMWQHNFNLEEKIVDILEVGYPDLIITDGIEMSFGGNQLTQHGIHLGIIIMAKNPVAHDAVCAHILNLVPEKITYLRIAQERGYGSLDLKDIDISGDISLKDLQEKTRDFDLGYMNVKDVKCGFHILCGEPYCTGGCHGVFLDWLYMVKDRKPELWKKLPEWTVVIGKYTGDVRAKRVMLIGTCTEVLGKLEARSKFRVKGCPPRHKDLVLWLFLRAGIVNPLFRIDLILDSYLFLFFSWCRRFFRGRL